MTRITEWPNSCFYFSLKMINIIIENEEYIETNGADKNILFKMTNIKGKNFLWWKGLQILIFLLGIALIFTLLFKPNLGIDILWNGLIPVAPALLVISTGVWRNICPLASAGLSPRHLGLSKKKKLHPKTVSKINLAGVIFLLIIIPFRHVIFDSNGAVTAYLLIFMGITAFCLGLKYEWKSAWCSGICPVFPVEKIYGSNPVIEVSNAHCISCEKCVSPCPDSTDNFGIGKTKKDNLSSFVSNLMYGGFPGYIWGWFQVQDYNGMLTLQDWFLVFAYPIFGLCFTHGLYLWLKSILSSYHQNSLQLIFASSAVSIYYWFRVPALIGFGVFPGDGMLVDLSETVPIWGPTTLNICTTTFFFWWIYIKKQSGKSWSIRPPFSSRKVNA